MIYNIDKCSNLPLNLNLNTLEGDLSGWSISVFALFTTGLLFYHMTKMKTLKMKKTHAAFFSISFLISAILYISYAIFNFWVRTSILLNKEDSPCTKQHVAVSRFIYTVLSIFVSLIVIGICIQIFYDTIKLF